MLYHYMMRLSAADNLLVLAAAALVLAACAGSGAPAQAVALELGDSGLAPASVTVAVGQPVELNVENRTGVTHELAVADIPIVTSGGSGEHNMAGMSGDMAAMTAMPDGELEVRLEEYKTVWSDRNPPAGKLPEAKEEKKENKPAGAGSLL